jgi:hypothetical protein
MPDDNSAYTIAGTDTTTSVTNSRNRMRSPQHTANLNYTHTFSEALERELTVNVDYNRYNNSSTNFQETKYNLDYLGIGHMTKEQLMDYMYTGKYYEKQ